MSFVTLAYTGNRCFVTGEIPTGGRFIMPCFVTVGGVVIGIAIECFVTEVIS
jgi:hypothetical protein